MPETSIVVKLEDRYSSVLKSMSDVTKSFDKNAEHLEKTLHDLSGEKSILQAETNKARKAMLDAQKQFAATGDEADALKASLAGQEYEDYRRKMEAITKTMKETEKQIQRVSGAAKSSGEQMKGGAWGPGASGLSSKLSLAPDGSIWTFLSRSGTLKMMGEALSNLGGALVGSALGDAGSTMAGSIGSGLASGVSGGALFGPVGAAIGGIAGVAAGALNSKAQNLEARDEYFKSYVQDAYEGRLAAQEESLAAGSAVAGRREQDQIAFTKRFGSKNEAEDFLEKVKTMSVETNYSYDEITGYSKLLLNTYGSEETLDVLQKLSDATAGLNLDSGGVEAFIKGLSRMRTLGKTTQEYLNLFSERGLDVYEALSRKTGKGKAETMQMVTGGEITGGDAAQAILDYIQDEPFPKKRTQNAEKKRNESAPFGCPV